jgi:hypothetical protein
MSDGDSMMEDALQVTRNLHRLIIATSLVTIVFSLSLRFPEKFRERQETIDQFLRFDFSQYDRFVTARAAEASGLWLKPVVSTLRAGVETNNYPVFGLADIWAALEKPVLLGQAKIAETKLTTPAELTLRQFDALAELYPLTNDVLVPVFVPENLVTNLQEFLAEKARPGMRVQSVNLQTSESYSATEPPGEGETIKMLLSFELMPNGGPPSPYFQGVFDAHVRRGENTSFLYWLSQNPETPKFVTLQAGRLKWLPALDNISREMIDRRLGDVSGALNDEIRKSSPENKSVSLLGAEIPGLLLVYATPLILLALSYYFLFHLTHLCRFAARHKMDCERFAWLPLSLETGWVWESLFSLGILPLLALSVLEAQLWRFDFLKWAPGIFTLAAGFFIGVLTWKSIRQLGKLRGQIGKSARVHLWLKN